MKFEILSCLEIMEAALAYAKLILRHTASSSKEGKAARTGHKSCLCVYNDREEPQAKRQSS